MHHVFFRKSNFRLSKLNRNLRSRLFRSVRKMHAMLAKSLESLSNQATSTSPSLNLRFSLSGQKDRKERRSFRNRLHTIRSQHQAQLRMIARLRSRRCQRLISSMGILLIILAFLIWLSIKLFRNRSISFLYQQFEKEKEGDKKSNIPHKDKPKTGYTIYVSGKTITEDFLKKHFSEFGTIVNVSMEIEKGRGFVTFSKTEATDRAISDVSDLSFQLEFFNFESNLRCTARWLMEYNWRSHWRESSLKSNPSMMQALRLSGALWQPVNRRREITRTSASLWFMTTFLLNA